MDRTAVRFVPMQEQEEAFCLNLSVDERLRVLEELNAMLDRFAACPSPPIQCART